MRKKDGITHLHLVIKFLGSWKTKIISYYLLMVTKKNLKQKKKLGQKNKKEEQRFQMQ